MTKKQLIELAFSKKTYETIPTEDMAKRVGEIEQILQKKLSIWEDEDVYAKYQLLNKLNLSDRRLMIVYSLLDGSVTKTASYFKVNKKTILANLQRIKELINIS
jgi:hypothetical protein